MFLTIVYLRLMIEIIENSHKAHKIDVSHSQSLEFTEVNHGVICEDTI